MSRVPLVGFKPPPFFHMCVNIYIIPNSKHLHISQVPVNNSSRPSVRLSVRLAGNEGKLQCPRKSRLPTTETRKKLHCG